MTTKYAGSGSYGRRKSIYHTDPDCHFASDSLREVSESEVEYHDMRLCKWCDPDKNPNSQSKTDRSAYNALLEAGKNDADV